MSAEVRQITVLVAGGIGESGPNDTNHPVTGMLKALTTKLDTRFTAEWIPWIDQYGPATAWNGVSYAESLRRIQALVTHRLSIAGPHERFLLVGYSAGAHGMGNVAATRPANVVGFVGVADPARPRLRWPSGYGITGERYVKRMPVWWIANPQDVITSYGDGPLRTFSDVTRGYSAVDLPAWGRELSTQVWQEWWHNPSLDWGGTAIWLAGYLTPYPWGQHTGYDHFLMPGTNLTYLDWCAEQLNAFTFEDLSGDT